MENRNFTKMAGFHSAGHICYALVYVPCFTQINIAHPMTCPCGYVTLSNHIEILNDNQVELHDKKSIKDRPKPLS